MPIPYSTLITVPELARRDRAGLRIVDCRFDLRDPAAGRAAHAAGHIPGALFMDLDQDLSAPKTGKNGVVKDAIADAMLQQILLRPAEYDVIATLNLNGDYLSDALAAEVGGIGIAPGANLSDTVAMFEATHGTAPKYAGKDQVNPGSLILSAEMMLRHMGWVEAADLIIKGTNGAISAKTVTYDFERLMDGATLVSSSGFGDALIKHM